MSSSWSSNSTTAVAETYANKKCLNYCTKAKKLEKVADRQAVWQWKPCPPWGLAEKCVKLGDVSRRKRSPYQFSASDLDINWFSLMLRDCSYIRSLGHPSHITGHKSKREFHNLKKMPRRSRSRASIAGPTLQSFCCWRLKSCTSRKQQVRTTVAQQMPMKGGGKEEGQIRFGVSVLVRMDLLLSWADDPGSASCGPAPERGEQRAGLPNTSPKPLLQQSGLTCLVPTLSVGRRIFSWYHHFSGTLLRRRFNL
jgi:hypothetical protein